MSTTGVTSTALAQEVQEAFSQEPFTIKFAGNALLNHVFGYLATSDNYEPLLKPLSKMEIPEPKAGELDAYAIARRCKAAAKAAIAEAHGRYEAVRARGLCRVREVELETGVRRSNCLAVFPNKSFLLGGVVGLVKYGSDGKPIRMFQESSGNIEINVQALAVSPDGKSVLGGLRTVDFRTQKTYVLHWSEEGDLLEEFVYSCKTLMSAEIETIEFFPCGTKFLMSMLEQGRSQTKAGVSFLNRNNSSFITHWCGKSRVITKRLPFDKPTLGLKTFSDGSGYVSVTSDQVSLRTSEGIITKQIASDAESYGKFNAFTMCSDDTFVVSEYTPGKMDALHFSKNGDLLKKLAFGCSQFDAIPGSKFVLSNCIVGSWRSRTEIRGFSLESNKGFAFVTYENSYWNAHVPFNDGSGFVAASNVLNEGGDLVLEIRICDFDFDPDQCTVLEDGTILDSQGRILRDMGSGKSASAATEHKTEKKS